MPSAIDVLPAIAAAVGTRATVMIDSGVRGGLDVVRALALGAKAAFSGRPFVYGLGAMGEAGVLQALQVIQKELDVTMALTGTRDVKDASPELLRGV